MNIAMTCCRPLNRQNDTVASGLLNASKDAPFAVYFLRAVFFGFSVFFAPLLLHILSYNRLTCQKNQRRNSMNLPFRIMIRR